MEGLVKQYECSSIYGSIVLVQHIAHQEETPDDFGPALMRLASWSRFKHSAPPTRGVPFAFVLPAPEPRKPVLFTRSSKM